VPDAKLRIGVSACLLGDSVRFNGGHKRDAYVMGTLSEFCDFVPVCPEVEVGMGTPREAVRLVRPKGSEVERMVGSNSETDWTDRMNAYARDRVETLTAQRLDGYILKSRSPSCGLFRVKVYSESGNPMGKSSGLFAAELARRFPMMPIEEEGRLNDAHLRENFIVRLFALRRWRDLVQATPRTADLVKFHADHKYLLMAHSTERLRELGRIVAASGRRLSRATLDAYCEAFHLALQQRATTRKHTNTLQHIMGYFKTQLSGEDKQELLAAIEDYRLELVPLIVPITLIRHHTRNVDLPYIQDQVYLWPHPKELMLLNHV